MKLIELFVENFMGLSGTHSLLLDQLGLVHVAGVNADDPGNNSNGAGKSTILEALTWGLFGEGLPRPQGNSEQGVRADEVLNDTLGRQCRVVVQLAEDDITYRVERWRKWKSDPKGRQSNGQLLAIDGEITESLDEKETNRLVCEALGITHDIWCRGVVFGQESGFNFCDATAKSRQDILTTVMGLEEIDTWLERCRDEKRALTNKLATVDGKLEVLASERDRLAAEQPAKEIQAWEQQRSERLAHMMLRLTEIEARGKQLKVDLDGIVVPGEPAPNPVQPVNESEQSGFGSALSEAQARKHEAQSRVRTIDGESARIMQLSPSSAEALCPTCQQVITTEHVSRCLDKLAAMKESVEQEVLGLQERENEAQIVWNHAQQQIKAKRAEWQQAESERQRLIAERATVAQRHQLIERQLLVTRTDWHEQSQQIELVKGEVNPHMAYQAEMEGRIERNAAELEEAREEQQRIAQALDVCIWWDKELPRFKTWMFDAVTDTLAAEANRWLGIMSGGVIWVQITTTKQVAKRLKDELDVQIYRWQPDGTIVSRPYRVWSGGEKRRVALAVDLGLSRLMAQRASKAYRFLALDEVDRHLDDRGKDGLRQVLDELRRDKETVITVTHDPEFRASFDTEIVVTRQNSQTRMEIRDGQGSDGTEAAHQQAGAS